jgi:prevent-host-death family protein
MVSDRNTVVTFRDYNKNMKVGVKEAKTNLSKLIDSAVNGEQIIITSRGKALVQLLPVPPHPASRNRGRGWMKGLRDVKLYPGWDSRETKDEISALFDALK